METKPDYDVRALHVPVYPADGDWDRLRALLTPRWRFATQAWNYAMGRLFALDPGIGSDGKLAKLVMRPIDLSLLPDGSQKEMKAVGAAREEYLAAVAHVQQVYQQKISELQITRAGADPEQTKAIDAEIKKLQSKLGMEAAAGTHLYRLLAERFAGEDTSVISSIGIQALKKYEAKRWDILTGRSQLPTARYPQPYPLPKQAWRNLVCEEGCYFVEVRFPGLPQDTERYAWVKLRIKGGKRMWRQNQTVAKLASGEWKAAEFALFEKGPQNQRQLMLKLVYKKPRLPRTERALDGELMITTAPDALLKCRVKGASRNEVWRVNGDQAQSWIAQRDRRSRRLAEDRKAERRSGGHSDLDAVGEKRSEKYERRIDTFIHQITAQAVNRAIRLGVASVYYDDRDRGWLGDRFPYAAMESKLQYKLASAGIGFETAKVRAARIKHDKAEADALIELAQLNQEIQNIQQEKNDDDDRE